MRHLINAALAATALHVLNTVFKAVPDHAAARFAVLEAERVQRVRESMRRAVYMEAVETAAAVRLAEYGDEDYDEWIRENGWAEL